MKAGVQRLKRNERCEWLNDLNSSGSGLRQQFLHFPHRLLDPDHNGASDDAMADIELDDLGNFCDWENILVIEAMAGVDLDTQALRQSRCRGNRFPLPLTGTAANIAISSGVDFNRVCAGFARSLDLGSIGIDEQAHMNTAVLQAGNGVHDLYPVRDHVETALGGELLSLFRHKARVVRTQLFGKSHHRRRNGHFQIELGCDSLAQPFDVVILNMPAIFAQMNGNAVRAGLFGERRGFKRIGSYGTARLAHGCHMIDIDAEPHSRLLADLRANLTGDIFRHGADLFFFLAFQHHPREQLRT